MAKTIRWRPERVKDTGLGVREGSSALRFPDMARAKRHRLGGILTLKPL